MHSLNLQDLQSPTVSVGEGRSSYHTEAVSCVVGADHWRCAERLQAEDVPTAYPGENRSKPAWSSSHTPLSFWTLCCAFPRRPETLKREEGRSCIHSGRTCIEFWPLLTARWRSGALGVGLQT